MITGIQAIYFIDCPIEKTVKVRIRRNNHWYIIDLWIGNAYDTIGDWTSADANIKINDYFANLSV